MAPCPIDRARITGLVLAGGQGRRMDGIDKGLAPYRGTPLALHALMRLAPQVGAVAVSANRHLDVYAGFGVPVWPDELGGVEPFAGPLAGLWTALARCQTPWLATVPCDSPRFPLNLVARLAQAAARDDAEIAVAASPPSPTGEPGRAQPAFCLVRADLADSLKRFLRAGGRRVGEWTERHRRTVVAFDDARDDPQAFANANTAHELQALAKNAA